MKSIKVKVLAFAAASILVASCAKEKDGYDKNLTKSAWKIASGCIVEHSIDDRNNTDGTDYTTTTQRSTENFSASTDTSEDYQLDTEVGSPDFFQKQIYGYDMTTSIAFGEDGVSKTDA